MGYRANSYNVNKLTLRIANIRFDREPWKGIHVMREHSIKIDTVKCIGCGLCQKDCPESNILVANKRAKIISQGCIKCGHCVAICPKEAVSMTGFDEMPIEIKNPTILDSKQLLEAIRSRRSIRHFTNKQVTSEVIKQVIEAGRLTPTAGNAQNVSYLVLKNDIEKYEKIAVRLFRKWMPVVRRINPMAKNITIDKHFFFKNASTVILILSRDKINAALAASNMELMAQACGLGVLYSGFFSMAANHSPSLRKALRLKQKDKVVTALVLGYSDVKYYRTVQKETADVRVL